MAGSSPPMAKSLILNPNTDEMKSYSKAKRKRHKLKSSWGLGKLWFYTKKHKKNKRERLY